MSLLEILGNYYDSSIKGLSELPTVCQFEFSTELKKSYNNHLALISTAQINGTQHKSSSDILNLCNRITENFYVNNEIYERDLKGEAKFEKFRVEVDIKGRIFTTTIDRDIDINEILHSWVDTVDHIPKEFYFKVKVTRTPNIELRKLISLQATRSSTPQEYFAKVCNSSFSTSSVHNKRQAESSFPRDSIKRIIIGHNTKKSVGIFLAEYLYGVKIPKSATYPEFFRLLANRSQTDFGIKDVQILKKLVETLRNAGYASPISTTTSLLRLGIFPATNLERWHKSNPGLMELTLARK